MPISQRKKSSNRHLGLGRRKEITMENKNKKENYFVFDLDNTLVKTNKSNNEAYAEAIKGITGKTILIKQKRFTRDKIVSYFPNIDKCEIIKIIQQKEDVFHNYLNKTLLNIQLYKILKIINELNMNTILLTQSSKKRAEQILEYYSLTHFFKQIYCKEDYNNCNKYRFLKENFDIKNLILFENENKEIKKAKQIGLQENQIITIKF
jgi:FMN phosphatase YigB (HAD superfamily)